MSVCVCVCVREREGMGIGLVIIGDDDYGVVVAREWERKVSSKSAVLKLFLSLTTRVFYKLVAYHYPHNDYKNITMQNYQ